MNKNLQRCAKCLQPHPYHSAPCLVALESDTAKEALVAELVEALNKVSVECKLAATSSGQQVQKKFAIIGAIAGAAVKSAAKMGYKVDA